MNMSFHLDRIGKRLNVPVPYYRAINEVPLPCERNSEGMIVSLMHCFNCGSGTHRLEECQATKRKSCIQMNRAWMQDYARIGVKKDKENIVPERYFVQRDPDAFWEWDSDSQPIDKISPPDLQIITDGSEEISSWERAHNAQRDCLNFSGRRGRHKKGRRCNDVRLKSLKEKPHGYHNIPQLERHVKGHITTHTVNSRGKRGKVRRTHFRRGYKGRQQARQGYSYGRS